MPEREHSKTQGIKKTTVKKKRGIEIRVLTETEELIFECLCGGGRGHENNFRVKVSHLSWPGDVLSIQQKNNNNNNKTKMKTNLFWKGWGINGGTGERVETQRDIWAYKGTHRSIEENMIIHIDTKELEPETLECKERRDNRECAAL